jgi:hypothetical protein
LHAGDFGPHLPFEASRARATFAGNRGRSGYGEHRVEQCGVANGRKQPAGFGIGRGEIDRQHAAIKGGGEDLRGGIEGTGLMAAQADDVLPRGAAQDGLDGAV